VAASRGPAQRSRVHVALAWRGRYPPPALPNPPTLTLWDGEEVLCACDRCSARGYGDVVDDVMGGALFEDECPNEAPPKIPRSR
jgi:hypothetical protein